ncbi:WYL domain-containing protein [Nocardioides guangzhouensis]|uniref:WYL domain-containing protein n=1 Tax=Nocardioides guangzhouensis TaxID=2497878 RepID=A0A4Q4Z8X0_9ACTN|nr:WYL domain-containing protein [Nocardioides guangzhouensis]RYP83596.1 WYL domain-containing protein [Nocardioides guangzhouensis]
MSGGAKEQVGRLLALVPLIQRRGAMAVDEAAAALGVAPDQLVKDLRVLIYCGWPGWLPGDLIEVDLDALDGEGVIRITNADYLRAPLRLSPAEASAMIVALRTLRESADGATLASLDSVLAKLEGAAEDGRVATGRVDVHLPRGQREAAALRARLGQAITEGRQVRLTYYVPSRDEETVRTVDPLELVDAQGSAYLQAWCHVADNRRLFRMDRVRAAEVLDAPAQAHPEVPPLDLRDTLFQPAADNALVTLLLRPEARWVAEYYPVEATRETGDGGLEVDLYVADPRWLTRLLLRLSPSAAVVRPQELTESFTAAARDALRLYS